MNFTASSSLRPGLGYRRQVDKDLLQLGAETLAEFPRSGVKAVARIGKGWCRCERPGRMAQGCGRRIAMVARFVMRFSSLNVSGSGEAYNRVRRRSRRMMRADGPGPGPGAQ